MRSRLWLVLFTITLFVTPALAQKRNITEKDLFNFVWAGDTQISPDGSRVAFVRVTVNDKKDGYNTAIWSVAPATGETRQLTSGPRDTTPRWSPDGKFLVFVRVPEKDGRPEAAQLFMLLMAAPLMALYELTVVIAWWGERADRPYGPKCRNLAPQQRVSGRSAPGWRTDGNLCCACWYHRKGIQHRRHGAYVW